MSGRGFAGSLDARVFIERWEAGSDDLGGDPGTWVPVQPAWAKITLDPGRTAADGDAPSVRQRYRIDMRDDPDVGLRHRLVWNDKPLTLLAIERDPAQPDRMRMIAEARP